MKKKDLLIAILLSALISAMFSALSIVEVQATENQVTLSGGGKTYYGVFVAGSGEGPKKTPQENAFKNSRNDWANTLVDEGEGWAWSRITPLAQPTKAELKAAIDAWKDIDPGKEFHFYFCGHGGEDGQITLKDGVMHTDELAAALSGFRRGVTISIAIDACYASGTVEDVCRFIRDANNKPVEPQNFAGQATSKKYSFRVGPITIGTKALIWKFKLGLLSTVYAKPVYQSTCTEIYNMTYGDQDGDGLVDEDGGILGDYSVENCILDVDDDGDGSIDEDPPTQQGSHIAGPEGVGGIVVSVDKFGLLAPYIGLASTILVATVATNIYAKHVKRRKEKQ